VIGCGCGYCGCAAALILFSNFQFLRSAALAGLPHVSLQIEIRFILNFISKLQIKYFRRTLSAHLFKINLVPAPSLAITVFRGAT
jgi:hypothetical protein